MHAYEALSKLPINEVITSAWHVDECSERTSANNSIVSGCLVSYSVPSDSHTGLAAICTYMHV